MRFYKYTSRKPFEGEHTAEGVTVRDGVITVNGVPYPVTDVKQVRNGITYSVTVTYDESVTVPAEPTPAEPVPAEPSPAPVEVAEESVATTVHRVVEPSEATVPVDATEADVRSLLERLSAILGRPVATGGATAPATAEAVPATTDATAESDVEPVPAEPVTEPEPSEAVPAESDVEQDVPAPAPAPSPAEPVPAPVPEVVAEFDVGGYTVTVTAVRRSD